MFEAFKKNIQTVQDGITAGLQRLSVSENCPPSDSKIDFTAGSEVLEVYQTQWTTIHHLALQNAQSAEVVDKQISNLKGECERQHNQIIEIHSLLAHLPNIMSQLHSMLATIGSVRGLFEDVEGELLNLMDLDEELKIQEEILDMKMKLTIARENNEHKLKQLQYELSQTHQLKLEEAERKDEEGRKEREKKYADQFQADLKNYKEHGNIKASEVSVSKNEVKLEDIDLDDQDRSNLESFLGDTE